ncbi:hypothetical protein [Sphingomonas sp. LT1P40]|uniref:hypothetical protein n=1 Tax=Alteristakelama amylovorans TaxID=3096166 RepID=UPI002FC5C9B2
MRALTEALHIAAGIAFALMTGAVAAWAYVLAARDVWIVTAIAIVCIMLMGIGPMRRAVAADRADKEGTDA